MAMDCNNGALYTSQLVFQSSDYHVKREPGGDEKVRLSERSDCRTAVEKRVLTLELECARLREELECQRHLNETLMVQNDNIDSKWRELVTGYEQKFQACEKRLQKHSKSDMSTEEASNGLGREIYEPGEISADGGDMSDLKYQKPSMANGSEIGLNVANAVTDHENSAVQAEVSSLRSENAELRELCQTAMRNQQQLSRSLAEKTSDAKEKEHENTALKEKLCQAEARSDDLERTLASVREENKKLSSELEVLRDKISKLEGPNNQTAKCAEEKNSDAIPAGEDALSDMKPTPKPREGVVLREPKSRTSPNYYRHSIGASSLPRPFVEYSAPERKKSFGQESGEQKFLQRKVNASYLNAFKPRPFAYKPINFNPRRMSVEEAEGTDAQKETEVKADAKECEQESTSQGSEQPPTQLSGDEESEGAKRQDVAPDLPRDVRDGKPTGLLYESDEDEELMKAKKDKVNSLRDMWNTKTEVTDV